MKFQFPPWQIALVLAFGCLLADGLAYFLTWEWGWGGWLRVILVFAFAYSTSFLLVHLLIYRRLKGLYHRLLTILQRRTGSEPQVNRDPVQGLSQAIVELSGAISREFRVMRELDVFRKEYIAIVSHELKTPIFAIEGFLETLNDGALEDPKVNRKFIQQALRNVHRLNNLVQDLIVISQLDSGEMVMRKEPFKVYEVVLDVFENLQAMQHTLQLNPDVQLRVQANGHEPTYVYADPERIRQVLLNLVANGLIHGRREGGTVQVVLNGKGDKLTVSVQDDGEGIPSEYLPRIFDRFYRVEKSRTRERGGSGLGLSIVKSMLEAHGEAIQVSSKLGIGTRFSFQLPFYRPD